MDREQIERLLEKLCVELGFCLPPDGHAALVEDPPNSVVAFTDQVFRAEGLDPRSNKQLYRQVMERVATAWPRLGLGRVEDDPEP